jgi:hypothetical protein
MVKRHTGVVHQVAREQAQLRRHRLFDDEPRNDEAGRLGCSRS